MHRTAGSNLLRMIKKQESRKSLLQDELCLLETIYFSSEEKQTEEVLLGIRYLDRGNLLMVQKPILNFKKLVIENVCSSIINESYKQLGLK